MQRIRKTVWLMISFALVITACGNGQQQQQAKPDYKETKQMIVDIMQTEDGKKAVMEVISDPKFKQKVIIDHQMVQNTLEKTITDPKNKKQLFQIMKDPKFAAELGKTLKEQHEKLLKDLMKDPEYQKMLIDVMKDPEFEKALLDTMKSNAYRQQMMTVMKESLQSPMFRLELMEIMSQAQKQLTQPEQGGKKGEKGQQGQQQNQGGGK